MRHHDPFRDFHDNFHKEHGRHVRRFALAGVGLMLLNAALALGMLGGGLWIVIYVLRATGVIN